MVLKADEKEEKLLYHQINQVLEVLDTESQKVGLSFINDKAQVLLPQNLVPKPELLPPGVVILSNT